MNDFGFVITAYDQVDFVKDNINRIRSEYPKVISNSPIIIITTHEDDLFSNALIQFKNVYLIHYKDAPGNKDNKTYISKLSQGERKNWRGEFLPIRILTSLQLGIEKANSLNLKRILHLHSDTYWKPEKIDKLLLDIKLSSDYLIIGDLSIEPELSSIKNNVIPPFFHFQPEGLMINIEKAIKTGFYKFDEIWKKDSLFQTHNYMAIEAIIGQYAHFSLTNKCIVKKTDIVTKEYYKQVKVRTIRNYHGIFNSGLVNLPPSEQNSGLNIKWNLICLAFFIFYKIKTIKL